MVWGKDGSVTEGEARCRVTCGAIAGTSFLAGDDLSDVTEGSAKDVRITSMLANPDVVAVAKLGKAFRPWKVTPGERSADVFFLRAGDDVYYAFFNFSTEAREFTVPAEMSENLRIRELWRGTDWETADGTLVYTVPAGDAAICKVTAIPSPAEDHPAAEETEQERDSRPEEASPGKPEARKWLAPLIGVLGCASVGLTAALIIKKRRAGK